MIFLADVGVVGYCDSSDVPPWWGVQSAEDTGHFRGEF